MFILKSELVSFSLNKARTWERLWPMTIVCVRVMSVLAFCYVALPLLPLMISVNWTQTLQLSKLSLRSRHDHLRPSKICNCWSEIRRLTMPSMALWQSLILLFLICAFNYVRYTGLSLSLGIVMSYHVVNRPF